MTRYSDDIEDLLGPPTKARRGPGRPPMAPNERYNEARAQKEELRVAKMRGELVEAAAVEATWASIIAESRSRVLAVPARVGADLGLSPEQVAAIDAELRRALQALGGGPDAISPTPKPEKRAGRAPGAATARSGRGRGGRK